MLVTMLAACAARGAEPARDGVPVDIVINPDAASAADATPAAEPAPSPTPTAPPYEPAAAEVYPNAKRAAALVAQHVTSYIAGQPVEDVARTVATERIDVATVAGAIAPLIVEGASSAGTVVYAQLGGVREPAVSVMVVVRQDLQSADGSASSMTRTLDVRLAQIGDRWVFEGLPSVGGTPVVRPPDLAPLASAVVDHPAIQLPDSAKWDIYRGGIDQRLLQAMLDMAERTPFAVTVLASGHPTNVFGNDRQSNHTAGRGVDVYATDGTLVVQQHQDGSPAYELSRWLYDRGIPELGSPWDFDAAGGRSFTDAVHADHLHVAFG